MTIYRDPFAARRDLARRLQLEIGGLVPRLTPALLRRVPPPVAQHLRDTSWAAMQIDVNTMQADELDAFIADNSVIRDAAKQALDLATELQRDLSFGGRVAPDVVPASVRADWSPLIRRGDRHAGHLPRFASVQARLAEMIGPLSPRQVEGWVDDVGIYETCAFAARFTHRGKPRAIYIEWGEEPASSPLRQAPRTRCVLGGPISRLAPRVSVGRERQSHTMLLKPLGLVQDVEFSDEAFDRRFLVRADDADEARRLLDPDARQQLILMALDDPPTLTVADGQALLRWSSSDLRLVERGLAVLQRIEQGLQDIRLLAPAPAPSDPSSLSDI